MRKTLLASIAALSFLAAGCNATTTLTKEQIASIQAITVAACGFLPTAVTIAGVVSGNASVIVPASQVASLICNAVTKQSGVLGVGVEKTASVTVKVDGKDVRLDVTGHFVR